MNRLLPLILSAPALAAFTSSSGPDGDAARLFAQRWVDAYNAHDGAAIADLYANGAILTWPGGGGLVVEDRATFEAGSVQWHTQAAADRLDLTPQHVRLVGGGAAVVKLEG